MDPPSSLPGDFGPEMPPADPRLVDTHREGGVDSLLRDEPC
jgi:hypothetical protein